jgi:hypothetical protein
MCQPISFVSDGKGGYRFFGFEERQKIAAGGVVDSSGNAITIDNADSHSAIAAFFNRDDDKCNKYEYDYVSNLAELDGGAGNDREAANKFARETLRPMVKKLVAEACDDVVFRILPDILGKAAAQKYALFAARQVLDIFEKERPGDGRPRAAIEAAERYIAEPTEDNLETCRAVNIQISAAIWAIYDAARLTRAAYVNAACACRAADTAYSASAAARAAASASASYYVYCAIRAACDANPACKATIIAYGRKLFAEENERV